MNMFGMNQRTVDGRQRAEIVVEGCGVKDVPGREPIIWIEAVDGKITMYVWADIAQGEPTHIIDLTDAQEKFRSDAGETTE